MIFKSDSQRRACFSKLNRFALKHNHYTGRVTSTEYPNVNFVLFVDNPKEALKALRSFPEQHLSGLGAIVADEHISEGKILNPNQLAVHTSGIPVYESGERGGEVSMIRTRSPESIAKYYEEHPEKGRYDFGDVLAHEIGHDVTVNVLGRRKMRSDKGASEVIADRFMQEYTGAKPKNKAINEDDADRAYAYLETLQELKTPSVGQMVRYAGINDEIQV